MHNKAQRKCFNMLVGTIPTFVPVQMNFPSRELLKFDKYVATFCLKSNGLSASDTKLRMFLPESMGGLGLISTMELDIISVAREFEIISNNISLDPNAFRTRISALENYPLHSLFLNKNHAREAIANLVRFGIFVRNSDEENINEILAEVGENEKGVLPFNHPNHRDNCTLGIGLDKEQNLQLMYRGPIHSILKHLKTNEWKKSDHISSMAKSFRISIDNLLSIRSKIIENKNNPSVSFLSFWEWRNINLNKVKSNPSEIEHWKQHSTPHIQRNHGTLEQWNCKNKLIRDTNI